MANRFEGLGAISQRATKLREQVTGADAASLEGDFLRAISGSDAERVGKHRDVRDMLAGVEVPGLEDLEMNAA